MDYKDRHIIQEMGETECAYCGKMFRLTRDSGSKYCSKACYFADKHRKKEERLKAKIHHVKCDVCGKEFVTALSNQKRCSKECRAEAERRSARERAEQKMVPRIITCKRCGKKFQKEYGNKRSAFCSKACAKAYNKYKNRKGYKKKYKNYNPVLFYEILLKRDNGLCKLCGLPVVRDKHADDYWSGAVDHIVPVTKGGTGSIENCQLVHRICNSLKGNSTDVQRIDWQQLGTQEKWREQVERLRLLTTPRGRSTFKNNQNL